MDHTAVRLVLVWCVVSRARLRHGHSCNGIVKMHPMLAFSSYRVYAAWFKEHVSRSGGASA